MRSGRVKPGESAGFPRPVLYLVLHPLLLLMNSPYGRCRRKRALLVGCGGQLRSGSAYFVDTGGATEAAPFRPRAVVAAPPAESQQLLASEPRLRTALADAAVGD